MLCILVIVSEIEMVKEKQNSKERSQDSSSENSPSKQKAVEKSTTNVETKRLDPTRYGDWEKNGRCIDF